MNEWQVPGRYDFSIPEAQWLSDLYSIESDLENVIRICNKCEKLSKELIIPIEQRTLEWFEDYQMFGDLTFAAIIWYGRTFGSGIRKTIPKQWIDKMPINLQKEHNYFKELRNKYIAHSVNKLEDNQIFVLLSPQIGENQKPKHITVEKGRLIAISSEKVVMLKNLSEYLMKIITEEVEKEKSQLLKLASSKTLEEIKARKTESTKVPSEKETFKNRERWK